MSRILTKQEQLDALASLGQYMRHPDEALMKLIASSHIYNAWFTPENTLKAVVSFGEMLNKGDLDKWLDNYHVSDSRNQSQERKIGLILAGNIPLVGFHDVICVLAAGHIAQIKLSSQDHKLIPFLLNKLAVIEPAFGHRFTFVERLEAYDAVIATGSNNTSRYFQYYFSKVPHIIRKNRNSVAVLTGHETSEQLKALGCDIFDYFGLGCRNVSKLYVPRGYNFDLFFQSVEQFKEVIHHHKYHNNYDYNKSILLVNRQEHLDNGFLLVKPDERLASSLAVLHYEEYESLDAVKAKLEELSGEVQCIVSDTDFKISSFTFGDAQHPKLWDYADNVDTMNFLVALS